MKYAPFVLFMLIGFVLSAQNTHTDRKIRVRKEKKVIERKGFHVGGDVLLGTGNVGLTSISRTYPDIYNPGIFHNNGFAFGVGAHIYYYFSNHFAFKSGLQFNQLNTKSGFYDDVAKVSMLSLPIKLAASTHHTIGLYTDFGITFNYVANSSFTAGGEPISTLTSESIVIFFGGDVGIHFSLTETLSLKPALSLNYGASPFYTLEEYVAKVRGTNNGYVVGFKLSLSQRI